MPGKKRRKTVRQKKKMKALDKYVIFSIALLILFTVAQFYVLIKTGVEASALTTCFFSVFGGEILTCGLIKIFKLKGSEKEKTEESEEEVNG